MTINFEALTLLIPRYVLDLTEQGPHNPDHPAPLASLHRVATSARYVQICSLQLTSERSGFFVDFTFMYYEKNDKNKKKCIEIDICELWLVRYKATTFFIQCALVISFHYLSLCSRGVVMNQQTVHLSLPLLSVGFTISFTGTSTKQFWFQCKFPW